MNHSYRLIFKFINNIRKMIKIKVLIFTVKLMINLKALQRRMESKRKKILIQRGCLESKNSFILI